MMMSLHREIPIIRLLIKKIFMMIKSPMETYVSIGRGENLTWWAPHAEAASYLRTKIGEIGLKNTQECA